MKSYLRKSTLLSAFVGLGTLVATSSASHAQDVGVASGDQQLTRTVSQQQIRSLPEDNVAFFGASRQVRLQLDLLAVGVQGDLDDVLVSVIRPDGRRSDVTPDASGIVTIRDLKPGPHAVVASSANAHGATLYNFVRKSGAEGDFDELMDDSQPIKTLTMLQMDPERLRPTLRRIRTFARTAALTPMELGVGESYSYQATLGPDGTLSGRVISITDEPVGGTQIEIMYAGQSVGSTVTGPDGSFQIRGLRSGVHGLIASGPSGYSAMAFEARSPSEVAESQIPFQQTFVSLLQGVAQLPVVQVPPQQLGNVINSVQQRFPSLQDNVGGEPVPVDGLAGGTFAPAPPAAGFAPGAAGGGGFAGGGGGGGFLGGGAGGLAGLGSLAAVAAVLANDDNDGVVAAIAPPIAVPVEASPSDVDDDQ